MVPWRISGPMTSEPRPDCDRRRRSSTRAFNFASSIASPCILLAVERRLVARLKEFLRLDPQRPLVGVTLDGEKVGLCQAIQERGFISSPVPFERDETVVSLLNLTVIFADDVDTLQVRALRSRSAKQVA